MYSIVYVNLRYCSNILKGTLSLRSSVFYYLLIRQKDSIPCLLTLGRGFALRAGDGHHPFVDLDAGDDAAVLQHLHEWRTVVRFLVERLVEEDDSRDGIGHSSISGEQQLPVQPPVLLCALYLDAVETFRN